MYMTKMALYDIQNIYDSVFLVMMYLQKEKNFIFPIMYSKSMCTMKTLTKSIVQCLGMEKIGRFH